MGRKQKGEYAKTIEAKLPEGWEIVEKYYREGSEYAIVKIRTDDIEKVKLLKLPEEVREYLRLKQRKYRKKLKEKKRKYRSIPVTTRHGFETKE